MRVNSVSNFEIGRKQSGLSLIELMVSMTIGLILMAGVVQIFSSNKKTFEISRDLVDMQENGRMGLTFLAESIRNADHWAGLDGSALIKIPSLEVGGCDLMATEVGFQGYEGDVIPPVGCIDGTRYVPNSDVLIIRYADGRDMLTDADLALSDNDDNLFVRIATSREGRVFQGSDSADAIAAIPMGSGVVTFPYSVEMFFLRPCSILNGTSNTATCVDDSPTLVRKSLQGVDWVEQPLVEGVEQLQFDYGVDLDEDLLLDEYQDANTVADWNTVTSVRMSIIARSAYVDTDVLDTRTFEMHGGHDYTPVTADQQFRRKQYDREIHIRNRSRL